MDKTYIAKKIENCEKLIETAISDDQEKIYQEYLDLWTKKLPAKERPEAIAKKAEAEQKKAEAIAFEKAIERHLKVEDRIAKEAELAAEKEKADKIIAAKKLLADLEGELLADPITTNTISFNVDFNELEFEKLFPGKKAYRTQNGDRIKTIAYKEFLTQKTQ